MATINYYPNEFVELITIVEKRSNDPFYLSLYHLFCEKINRKYKIAISFADKPYIPMMGRFGQISENFYRTLTLQPSLLSILNHDNIHKSDDYIEIGRVFVAFLLYMIRKEKLDEREKIRKIIIHNFYLLHSQYNDQYHLKEVTCLRRICINIFTPFELQELLAGKIL